MSSRGVETSISVVLNSAINGANFLQAFVKNVHTYSHKISKANLLGATKSPLLNKNIKQLDNHLGKIRSQTAKISANHPIQLDIKTSSNSLKMARKEMTAIEHDAKQTAFWTQKSADNLRLGANVPRKSAPIASGLGVGITEISAPAGKLGDVGIQGSLDATKNIKDGGAGGTTKKIQQVKLDTTEGPFTNASKWVSGLGSTLTELGSTLTETDLD
jgi:hypothetical protein